jgi:hypothetical protein
VVVASPIGIDSSNFTIVMNRMGVSLTIGADPVDRSSSWRRPTLPDLDMTRKGSFLDLLQRHLDNTSRVDAEAKPAMDKEDLDPCSKGQRMGSLRTARRMN